MKLINNEREKKSVFKQISRNLLRVKNSKDRNKNVTWQTCDFTYSVIGETCGPHLLFVNVTRSVFFCLFSNWRRFALFSVCLVENLSLDPSQPLQSILMGDFISFTSSRPRTKETDLANWAFKAKF